MVFQKAFYSKNANKHIKIQQHRIAEKNAPVAVRQNTEEVSAMKNVRVWYKKDGACRFISHLDLNHCIMRAMQMSGIPFWHTEGFNSRMYVSFPLPLSLGYRGLYECVDVRLLKDDYPFDEMITRLNNCLPTGLSVFEISEPLMKPAAIAYALFDIVITAEGHTQDEIFKVADTVLGREQILVEKLSKKGVAKQVDLKENIVKYKLDNIAEGVKLKITLPAGSAKNVNPSLLIDVIEKECGFELFTDITKCEIYNEKFELFK